MMTTDVIERAQSRIAENNSEIERRIADNARWQEFLVQAQELVGEIEPQPSLSSSPVPAAQAEEGTPASSADLSQAKASTDGGATVPGIEGPADSVTGDASRPDAGRSASATPEIMGETAGETAPVHEATGKSAEPSGSAAPLSLREQVRICHLEHPDWPAKIIAAHLGCPSGTVSGYASKLGLSLPSVASYEAVQAARTTEALKAAAAKAMPGLESAVSGTLESRVRAMHAQRPNFTARMIAKELGANLNSVATLLAQIRKTVPAPIGKPEFSSRKEMLDHYGEVAKRLGRSK
jgi:hypothetical protein